MRGEEETTQTSTQVTSVCLYLGMGARGYRSMSSAGTLPPGPTPFPKPEEEKAGEEEAEGSCWLL